MLEIKNLTYKSILENVNIPLPLNSTVAITGRPGAGKSTLLNCMSGIEEGYKGNILYNGIDSKEVDDFYKKSSIVMQNPENQLVTDSALNELVFSLENMNMNKKEIEGRVERVLNLFGHKEFFLKNPFINTLSGGEKQILILLSELIKEPEYIFLDEPFSMLDSKRKGLVIDFLKKSKTSLFLAVNDIETAFLCDYIVVLTHGKDVFYKKTSDISEVEWIMLHKELCIDIPVKIMKKILQKS